LDALGLRPAVPWDTGIQKAWSPGESGAWARLDAWRDGSVADYRDERDFPDRDGTSRLSPHLHFGEVGPAQVWHAVQAAGGGGKAEKGAEAWLRQVIWREFAHHLLYHFPHTTDAPMQEKFARFPWTRADKQLRQWQKGATGYPIVDAAMRALWETGWMHNRLRMVVASFLTKHLLLPWQEGARWFWDTLVDADLANNSLGWQWTAGCGADAAPYFRVFNPVLQGKKFDPEGHFVRRWVPELQRMPARHVHAPWEAPDGVLQEAAVRLGADYPHPMVDHGEARDRALEAWEAIK
jgi:deoxyribodipyrimidine photo-lyase